MRIKILFFLLILLMQRAKLNFFVKRFLISIILYDVSMWINLGFLIKEVFWYVVLILDFAGLNVCITFIRVQNLSSIWKIPQSWCNNVIFTKN